MNRKPKPWKPTRNQFLIIAAIAAVEAAAFPIVMVPTTTTTLTLTTQIINCPMPTVYHKHHTAKPLPFCVGDRGHRFDPEADLGCHESDEPK
jgi:hypothetical protein